MEKFNSSNVEKNKRLQFVSDFFDKKCEDNETIQVNAIGSDSIVVDYRRIKNKLYKSDELSLPAALLVICTDATVNCILNDVLNKLRE